CPSGYRFDDSAGVLAGLCVLDSVDMAVGDMGVERPDLTGGPLTPPSCMALPATCGAAGTDTCCANLPVPGGTFYRGYDVATDNMYSDKTNPATVSDFRLDRYEVTFGRFRKFVAAGMGTQASPPSAGSGANPYLANSGWEPSWNPNLVPDTATLTS